MFRVAFLLAASLAATTLSASGAESARSLLSAEAQSALPAVARLNRAGQGHCTATLIAPDLALTAAHCLDPRGRSERVAADRLHLLAGWRMGRFVAHYRGRALAVAPGWRPGEIASDLALIRLAPVDGRPEAATPLPVAPPPAPGAALAAYSYGRDRAEALSGETGCRLTARRGPLLLTDCEAVPGVSGAPLVIETEAGPALVGVVVAAAEARAPALRGDAVAVAAAPLLPALTETLVAAEAATR